MLLHRPLFAFVLLLLSAPRAQAQRYSPAEQDVLAVVELFFGYLTARDSAGMAAIMEPTGLLTVVDADDTTKPVRTMRHADFLGGLKKGDGLYLERYWDATVHLDSAVAVVACPYDFHINGVFSHCGTDIFTLVRRNGEWRIASTAYSKQTKGCPTSPLGPVKP